MGKLALQLQVHIMLTQLLAKVVVSTATNETAQVTNLTALCYSISKQLEDTGPTLQTMYNGNYAHRTLVQVLKQVAHGLMQQQTHQL